MGVLKLYSKNIIGSGNDLAPVQDQVINESNGYFTVSYM